jgi:tetratricopeptide (TPR) repeat protein
MALAHGPVPSSARTVMVLGLVGFLLHAMVDVAMFYPATMTTFFAAAALALAIGRRDAGEEVRPRPVWRAAAPAAAGAVWLAHFVFVWMPTDALQDALSAARRAARVETGDPLKGGNALRLYTAAAKANVWDPTAPAEMSDWLSSRAVAMGGRAADDEVHRVLYEAVRWAGVAAARDPKNIAIYRSLVDLHALRERLFDRVLDARAAVGAAQMAADLYPGSPRERLVLADRLAALAQREPAAELFDAAIEQYDNALVLDAARPGIQEIRRWPPEFRRAVEARRDAVRGMKTQALATRPASTQP